MSQHPKLAYVTPVQNKEPLKHRELSQDEKNKANLGILEALQKTNQWLEELNESRRVTPEMLNRVHDAPIRLAQMEEKDRFERALSALKERIKTKE
jgi:hypothetical protein